LATRQPIRVWRVIKHLERDSGLAAIAAIGHRVVHGGVPFIEPMRVTPQMLDQLRRISPLDPEHLPGEINLIEAFGGAVPGVPQVACFDTGFHRTMPRTAQIVPIPRILPRSAAARAKGLNSWASPSTTGETGRVNR